MTRNRWREDPKAVAEVERIHSFIGEYVICFQWLEGKMDEMILMSMGHENWTLTQSELAESTNHKKVRRLETLVLERHGFRVIIADDWDEYFAAVIQELHTERRRRNSLLHSQYLFDFLAIGHPVLKYDSKKSHDSLDRNQDLSEDYCAQVLREIYELANRFGGVCMQLRMAFVGHQKS